MPKYSLTNKGNIVQCKWNCQARHEHYVGTYEQAVKYFGIDENEIQSYGNLENIVIYHQTSPNAVRKLSNELYDILISAMSQHKYWVPENKRHETAINILKKFKKSGFIMDEAIIKTIKIKYKDNINQNRRVYMYERWLENL